MASPQDQAAPPQDAGASQDPGQEGSGMGAVGQLIQGIHGGLMQLGDLFSKAGLPDQDLQALQGVIQGFQQVVQQIMQDAQGGGQSQQPQPSQGGGQPQPMEQGKAKTQPANF